MRDAGGESRELQDVQVQAGLGQTYGQRERTAGSPSTGAEKPLVKLQGSMNIVKAITCVVMLSEAQTESSVPSLIWLQVAAVWNPQHTQ